MKAHIGYFIPEFPGQTHIFLWRERQVLEQELAIKADLVSTRHPPRAIASHTWAAEAAGQTDYLVPFSVGDLGGAIAVLLQAGLMAWWRCFQVIVRAKDTTLGQKIRLLALVFIGAKLGNIAKKRNWESIHVHSCADAANIALFAFLLTGIPYSMTLHGPTLEGYGPNQAQKWQYSQFALVVSAKLARYTEKVLADSLPPLVAVAPMGVNLDDIKRDRPYEPWTADRPCRLFACGRLNPVKGHKDLLASVKILRDRGIDVRLEIAGEDEQGGSGYHQVLDQIIAEKELTAVVTLLGAVSETRIREGLEAAHLFALASLNEGVPVAVMEAMAMAMPIVVTDVGGTSELVDSEVDGLLVPPESPEVMADAIERVLQHPDLALQLSQRSRSKVMENFNHRRSAEVLATSLFDTRA
ncbi:MAG: exopolysaccharide biosynthesis GT4 family glycosyltransferase EpsE [Jaaginema sp. PMC 1079.18]|nr:exopolysaccharide biosynthesis GT4 family glycosyltransferase EpsE [Jaaginema sp. PMC 1080.18]MEC4850566.1 exopolysaccharide biosynthesis GT4 family glycosyltransferase EpsE [Jaaginema sp. PMC 1079.18]MEC4866697.1 exopolysaccharide biosynthesis GT4 family glycosyltransferase EpsE [Jaaginema sp. PMC 1078.18]